MTVCSRLGTQVLYKLENSESFELRAAADCYCSDMSFLSSGDRSHSENGCQGPVEKKRIVSSSACQSCCMFWQLAKSKSKSLSGAATEAVDEQLHVK